MIKKISKISWVCLIITLVMSCIALHAGHYEIVPSSEGNVLKIYDLKPGKLRSEFIKAIFNEKYSHIVITGEMIPIDFSILSITANRCKSIDLSNVKTNKINGSIFGSTTPGDEVNLEKFVFPKDLLSIEQGTLNGCPSLKEVVLPENLKFIEENCFEWCPKLTLNIPLTVSVAGTNPFYASPHIKFKQTALPSSKPVNNLWSLLSSFFMPHNS